MVHVFFGDFSHTDKTDNPTCEIIYDNFTCENYPFQPVFKNGHFILFERIVFIQ